MDTLSFIVNGDHGILFFYRKVIRIVLLVFNILSR